jgi:uncharacterized phage infection (PIP) family protein YhgE
MNLKKSIFIVGLIILVILYGLYAKRKFYDPKHKPDDAKTAIKKLDDEGEFKNGK